MPDQKLLKKLLIKPGYRLLLLNAPGGFVESINPLDKEITIFLTIRPQSPRGEKSDFSAPGETGTEPAKRLFDYVHLFARNIGDLDHHTMDAIRALKPSGIFWISYPKKSYVTLQRNKTFALIKATTRDRLDLGLKLPVYESTERLQDSRGFGSGSITHRASLREMRDIDDELLTWLRRRLRDSLGESA